MLFLFDIVYNFVFYSEWGLFSRVIFSWKSRFSLIITLYFFRNRSCLSLMTRSKKEWNNRQYPYQLTILKIAHCPSFVYWTYFSYFNLVMEYTSFQWQYDTVKSVLLPKHIQLVHSTSWGPAATWTFMLFTMLQSSAGEVGVNVIESNIDVPGRRT